MSKNIVFIVVVLIVSCLFLGGAAIASENDFDFVRFAKEKVLKDFHPTANTSKAVAELSETPYEKEPGIIRAKVHMYYSGWIRRHEMLVEIDYDNTKRAVKVLLLNDSNGMNLLGNFTFKENKWVSLHSIGWK